MWQCINTDSTQTEILQGNSHFTHKNVICVTALRTDTCHVYNLTIIMNQTFYPMMCYKKDKKLWTVRLQLRDGCRPLNHFSFSKLLSISVSHCWQQSNPSQDLKNSLTIFFFLLIWLEKLLASRLNYISIHFQTHLKKWIIVLFFYVNVTKKVCMLLKTK